MVNIGILYTHFYELVKQDVDKILIEMIDYGIPGGDIVLRIVTNRDNYDVVLTESNDNYIGTDMSVDWGDGSEEESFTYVEEGDYENPIAHTYTIQGEYTITIKGVTELGNYALAYFFGYGGELILPKGLVLNGIGIFEGLGVSSITLPPDLRVIPDYCFSGFNSRYMNSISLPKTVTTIGEDAFGGFDNLEYIILNWTNSDDIIPCDNLGREGCNYIVPRGTLDLYLDAGYSEDYTTEAS